VKIILFLLAFLNNRVILILKIFKKRNKK